MGKFIGIAVVALLVVGLVIWWLARPKRDEAPLRAIVLMLSEPRSLNDTQLLAKAEAAWSMRFPADEDATEFVVGSPPSFIVQVADRRLLVNVFSSPYMDNAEEAAEQIEDMRYRHAVREHRAWISVDLLDDGDVEEGYRLAAKLAAELIEDDVLAVYSTETTRMSTPSEELLAGLRSDDPLGAIAEMVYVPVVGVSGDDEAMAAAVAEARETWPQFVEAFNAGRGEMHNVKAPVTDGENTEYMWVAVEKIDGNTIYGKLSNDPYSLKGIKADDSIAIELADLNDWNYFEDDKLKGGFTIAVLAPEMYEQLTAGPEQ